MVNNLEEAKTKEYLSKELVKNKYHLTITKRQYNSIKKIAHFLASKGFAVPSIFFLESVKPLSHVSSQILMIIEPFVTVLIPRDFYNDMQKLLEQRQGITFFLDVLEEVTHKVDEADKKRRELQKNLKKMRKVAKAERKKLENRKGKKIFKI